MISNMREPKLSALDLNLLPVLAALLRRRSITLAAADVGLSQPAVSRALQRLRDVLEDPLLIRSRSGYVLSPRAQELSERLFGVLSAVQGLYKTQSFDPEGAERTVRMAATDTQTVLLAPAIIARLKRDAPGIDVQIESYGRDLVPRIESGALDFAFATGAVPMPAGAVSLTLARDRLALVMRRGHPMAPRNWTLSDYGKVDHVTVALLGDGTSDLDARLAAEGIRRRIVLKTPHFSAALATVAATDAVTTISQTFARRFETHYDLILKPPPFAQPDFDIKLIWWHIQTNDPVLSWFRAVVCDIAREVFESMDASPTVGEGAFAFCAPLRGLAHKP
jgi:DNA-binding transcriptional LysR family regulator